MAWQRDRVWSRAELAAGEIPYGSQFGVDSAAVRLGEFIEALETRRASPTQPPAVVFHPFPVKNPKALAEVAPPRNWATFAEHIAAAADAARKASELMAEFSRSSSYSALLSPQGGAAAPEQYRKAAALYKKAISHLAEAPPDEERWVRQRAGCHVGRATCFIAMLKVDKAHSEAEVSLSLSLSIYLYLSLSL